MEGGESLLLSHLPVRTVRLHYFAGLEISQLAGPMLAVHLAHLLPLDDARLLQTGALGQEFAQFLVVATGDGLE